MTARVINDPSSLGWVYDPDTGRWSWGGGSSSGGGNGTFPEAPVNGKQYARQDAGWWEIVHPEGGDGTIGTVTTADVKLTNPTLRSPIGLDTQEDANQYFYGELGKLIDEDGNVIGGGGGIEEAPEDGVIYGRKNADWVVVPTSGGGDGPDMSNYYTAAQCDTKFQPKGTYDNYSGWNIKASGGTAQKVTKNYTVDFVGGGNTTVTRSGATITISSTGLTSYTETDPVFTASPAGGITQDDISKWNNPPSGGIPDAVSDGNIYGRKNGDWVVVPTSGGGDGPDMSSYYTAAQCDSKFVGLTGNQTVAGEKTFSSTTRGTNFVLHNVSQGVFGFASNAGGSVTPVNDGRVVIKAKDSTAFTINANATCTVASNITAAKFITSGGTASKLVCGDGSLVDKSTLSTDLTGYATETWVGNNYQVKGNYLTSADLNGYATETWVSTNYQPKGNYLTDFTETDPVFKASPAGGITQADIDKWNNPPSGGNDYDGSDAVKLTGNQSIAGEKTFTNTTRGTNFLLNGVTQGLYGFGSSAGGSITPVNDGRVVIKAKALTAFSVNADASCTASGALTVGGTLNTKAISAGGAITSTGTITGTDCIATSDERLKKNIEPVKVGVITQLDGVDFQWVQNDAKASGFIAQQVEEIPELSHLVHQTDEQGHKGVSYMGMIPYLLAEIKSLKERIEELENA